MTIIRKPLTTFESDSGLVLNYYLANQSEVCSYSQRAPNKRSPNEDATAIIPINTNSVVLAIADGAGGAPDGDIAARIAIESLVAELLPKNKLPLRASILNAFENANSAIRSEIPGAATTMVVVEISNQIARTYHVGDSGAYIIGGRGKKKLQTVFHSPTGYAVEAGLLSERQALMHQDRHVVSNVLGDIRMSVEIGSPIQLAPRDTILLASDGLFDNLFSAEITSTVCRGATQAACENLVRFATNRMLNAAEEPSKPDDLSIMLFRGRTKS